MNKLGDKIHIHMAYWIAILLIMLIGISTIRLGDNANVVEHIGFAATLTSIILAVVAIIYSFIQTLMSSSANEKIINSADRLEHVTYTVANAIESFQNLNDNLSLVEQRISDKILGVETTTRDAFAHLLNERVDPQIQQDPQNNHIMPALETGGLAILRNGTDIIRVFSYFLFRAYQRGKPVSLTVFYMEFIRPYHNMKNSPLQDGINMGIYFGYLNVLQSLLLVECDYLDNNQIIIRQFNKSFEEQIMILVDEYPSQYKAVKLYYNTLRT